MKTFIPSCLLAHFFVRVSCDAEDVELSDVSCGVASHIRQSDVPKSIKCSHYGSRGEGAGITITWAMSSISSEQSPSSESNKKGAIHENPRVL